MSLKSKLASYWPFPVKARIAGGHSMYVDWRSAVGRGIYATGTFDPAVLEAILKHSEGARGFIDVGANVGFYSFSVSTRLPEGGCVWAFEIDPRPLRCFRKTLRQPDMFSNITLVESALGAHQGQVTLEKRPDCGHSQVSSPEDGARGLAVNMTSLDDWHRDAGRPQVDVIKIDVEGFEGEVLRGAHELLSLETPTLILEVDDHLLKRVGWDSARLQGLLAEYGYTCVQLAGAHSPTWIAQSIGESIGSKA